MKIAALIAGIAWIAVGCQSKSQREICALHAAGRLSDPKAAQQLGLGKLNPPEYNSYLRRYEIQKFCEFYRY
jgi:hypothetical protein